MANSNDQKILVLKKQIEDKKSKLSKSEKFTPVTNCSIEVDGVRHNIQVLNKEQLITLMVKLNTYAIAAKDLDLLNEYNISGYNVTDWIADLKAKLEFLGRKEEERKLKAMESKLDQLLSSEKKVELEIGEIESMLQG
ncbi:hypothetical protein BRE01_60460 [Brevibacillus reuszeri]|uniref:Uncharacterized protein n=1 Tax=Brevibacillus reuszeri TaxID=54915 RepID=A0A0K9YPV3_9BACL|nr:hypothetical protein [Brevibacillus reuszeri]KNB70210.1 hypothetical protein ADS79_14675 [Brevibacillus reuszeri]MED1859166.1 hypothetical protein [Brevibacillus reuszeri]GED72344.1 hypothetical protein BRE01_60460 [Brevibacillus reuszeri]